MTGRRMESQNGSGSCYLHSTFYNFGSNPWGYGVGGQKYRRTEQITSNIQFQRTHDLQILISPAIPLQLKEGLAMNEKFRSFCTSFFLLFSAVSTFFMVFGGETTLECFIRILFPEAYTQVSLYVSLSCTKKINS